MTNYNEILCTSVKPGQLTRIFKSTGREFKNFECTDEVNYVLKRKNPKRGDLDKVDEAYRRYIVDEGMIIDSLRFNIVARKDDIILLYNSCLVNKHVVLYLGYKCKFKSEEDAILWMEKNKIPSRKRFIHSKTGKLYEVISDSGLDSETLNQCVIYKSLYGSGQIWVRPKSMFFENVEINGNSIPRFKELSKSN